MPAINHHISSPSPELISGAIHIPDDGDWGTGTFTTVLAPNALRARNPILSTMLCSPHFGITATINPNGDIVVFLGQGNQPQPDDQRIFVLPDTPRTIKLADTHELRISFIRWNITSAFFDNVALASKQSA